MTFHTQLHLKVQRLNSLGCDQVHEHRNRHKDAGTTTSGVKTLYFLDLKSLWAKPRSIKGSVGQEAEPLSSVTSTNCRLWEIT